MSVPRIAELLTTLPGGEAFPPYRAKQLFSWIQQGALSFDAMTNLPKTLVNVLNARCAVRGSSIQKKLVDADGTVKLVLELDDGKAVETVLLTSRNERESGGSPESVGERGNGLERQGTCPPETAERFTACLSTQAGCPMACVFCKTGAMGFTRNLTASEIVEQFLFLNDSLAHYPRKNGREQRISNIVVMGMGEPLLNLGALREALAVLCDDSGFGLSKRKITVSTAGICGGIAEMAENGPETELAVSIASAREELRARLMPGTAPYPLAELQKTLEVYQKKHERRITLETVLLEGINTTREDAAALIAFAKPLDVSINLIPWNPVDDLFFEGKKLRPCGQREIAAFTQTLIQGGITVTRRYRRGRGIGGACGQLGSPGEHGANVPALPPDN